MLVAAGACVLASVVGGVVAGTKAVKDVTKKGEVAVINASNRFVALARDNDPAISRVADAATLVAKQLSKETHSLNENIVRGGNAMLVEAHRINDTAAESSRAFNTLCTNTSLHMGEGVSVMDRQAQRLNNSVERFSDTAAVSSRAFNTLCTNTSLHMGEGVSVVDRQAQRLNNSVEIVGMTVGLFFFTATLVLFFQYLVPPACDLFLLWLHQIFYYLHCWSEVVWPLLKEAAGSMALLGNEVLLQRLAQLCGVLYVLSLLGKLWCSSVAREGSCHSLSHVVFSVLQYGSLSMSGWLTLSQVWMPSDTAAKDHFAVTLFGIAGQLILLPLIRTAGVTCFPDAALWTSDKLFSRFLLVCACASAMVCEGYALLVAGNPNFHVGRVTTTLSGNKSA